MKNYNYDSREYSEYRLLVANARLQLLKEALSVRLATGKVTADELDMFAEIYREAGYTVQAAERSLLELNGKEADGGND